MKNNKEEDNLLEIDFGQRTVSKQNSSMIITIPQIAWKSCGYPTKFNIKLVQGKGKTYVKLIPFDNTSQTVKEIDPLSGPQRKRI